MKLIKITMIILLVIIISAAVYVYFNRAFIFDYSINRLVKNLLPPYIEAEELNFDFKNKKVTVKDFKILNPAGFEQTYFLEIPEVRTSYSQKDEKNILKGLAITDIELSGPVIYFERSKKGEVNIQQMDEVFVQPQRPKRPSLKTKFLGFLTYLFSPVKKLSDLIEIKPVFNVRGGSFIFDDRYIYGKSYRTTIEDIKARIRLSLSQDLKEVNYVESEGRGLINGQKDQKLQWVISYDPKAPKLTMSNNFRIEEVDLGHFRPYYDKFSPFIIKSGRASGELVFNFDNAEIGSTNEVRLSALSLEVKEDFPNRDFWAASTEDLYKYFTSQSGEVLFDFKIKGPMDKPKFYLGSKTKRALARMVVDKVADALFKKEDQPQAQPGTRAQPQQEKSDIEKLVDIFKSLKKSGNSE